MNNNKILVYSYVKGYQKEKNFIELATYKLKHHIELMNVKIKHNMYI